MNIITLKAPTAEPLDKVEAKAHIVYSDTADDQLITDLIVGAREFVESSTWRRMMLQTVIISMDNWPGYDDYATIELPIAPLISVSGITYVDTAGVTQTLDPTIYQVDNRSHIPSVRPQYGKVFPPVQLQTKNAIQITALVGYATPFSTVFGSDPHTLNADGHGYQDGDCLQLYNSGGALPAGLSSSTNYYAVNVVAGVSLQLSTTSGGSAVTLTGDGTGSNFLGVVPRQLRQAMLLHIGLAYNNREAAVIDNRAVSVEIPFGLQAIIDRYALKAF